MTFFSPKRSSTFCKNKDIIKNKSSFKRKIRQLVKNINKAVQFYIYLTNCVNSAQVPIYKCGHIIITSKM